MKSDIEVHALGALPKQFADSEEASRQSPLSNKRPISGRHRPAAARASNVAATRGGPTKRESVMKVVDGVETGAPRKGKPSEGRLYAVGPAPAWLRLDAPDKKRSVSELVGEWKLLEARLNYEGKARPPNLIDDPEWDDLVSLATDRQDQVLQALADRDIEGPEDIAEVLDIAVSVARGGVPALQDVLKAARRAVDRMCQPRPALARAQPTEDAAPIERTQKEISELQRLRALEADICDLEHQADIASNLVEDSIGSPNSPFNKVINDEGAREVLMQKSEVDRLLFAVYDTHTRAVELRKQFYAVDEG
jgi:hypothetical protein